MRAIEYQVMREREEMFWWYAGMRSAAASAIERHALGGAHPAHALPLRILDAGSGTGMNLTFLARYGTAVGLELNRHAIALTRDRDRPALARGTVEHVPFRDGAFDLVTSFDVIYHQGVADDAATVAEFARVVRPGGHVLVRVPANDWLRGKHDLAVHTARRYSAAGLEAIFALAGLDVVFSTYINATLFPVAVVKRVAESVLGRQFGSDLEPVHPVLNALLGGLLAAEGSVALRNPLPFGLSVLCMGRKR